MGGFVRARDRVLWGAVAAGVSVAVLAAGCGVPGSWTVVAAPGPAGGPPIASYTDVSCASATECVAVGLYPTGPLPPQEGRTGGKVFAARWNGTSWAPLPEVPVEDDVSLLTVPRVDCASATACVTAFRAIRSGPALDTPDMVVASWDGTAWHAERPDVAGLDLSPEDVACASPSSCLVVAGGGPGRVALRWDGATWAEVASPDPTGYDPSSSATARLSCATPTFCAYVSYLFGGYVISTSTAQIWNGTSWSLTPPPFPPITGSAIPGVDGTPVGLLADIDCLSVNLCVAAGWQFVGIQQFASVTMTWNGTAWSRQPLALAQPPRLYALSCSTVDRCLAVDGGRYSPSRPPLVTGAAGGRLGWRTTQSPPGDLATWILSVEAVSCAGDWCMVVGAKRNEASPPSEVSIRPAAFRYRL